MRLGTVQFVISYVVDLDDEVMVDYATDCVYEDIMMFTKYDNLDANIHIVHDTEGRYTSEDIPEFLRTTTTEE